MSNYLKAEIARRTGWAPLVPTLGPDRVGSSFEGSGQGRLFFHDAGVRQ